jgi:hypothetical protein
MPLHRSHSFSPLGPVPSAARREEAGFTLVELMVALSGGLFLSMVVFALARDTTRFYQREGRLASATLAGIIGFERLKADIERAGYLSTPNILADPLNRTTTAAAPLGIQNLAAVRISPDAPSLTANPAFVLNAGAGQPSAPDSILLSGSYSATDEFVVAEASDGQTITLQTQNGPMARLGYLATSDPTQQKALLDNVFGPPGQILRYKNTKTGMLFFGVVATITGGPQPTITLASPMPLMSGGAAAGGVNGYGNGDSVNIVNLVRYRVMDLRTSTQGAAWAPLFTASQGQGATGENDRTELVRDQLNADGVTVVANTTELVAEYAVGLEFAVMGQIAPGPPTLALSVPTDSTFATYTGARPQGIRSVRVRLSVRSREADRSAGITGGLFRFKVGANEWARVRSFQADVALPNQRTLRW